MSHVACDKTRRCHFVFSGNSHKFNLIVHTLTCWLFVCICLCRQCAGVAVLPLFHYSSIARTHSDRYFRGRQCLDSVLFHLYISSRFTYILLCLSTPRQLFISIFQAKMEMGKCQPNNKKNQLENVDVRDRTREKRWRNGVAGESESEWERQWRRTVNNNNNQRNILRRHTHHIHSAKVYWFSRVDRVFCVCYEKSNETTKQIVVNTKLCKFTPIYVLIFTKC